MWHLFPAFHRPGGRTGCPYCQRPGFTTTCPECEQWQVRAGFILTVRACFGYNEAMKEFMHAYKFVGDYRLRQAFSAPLTKLVQEQGAQMVVPLPYTKRPSFCVALTRSKGYWSAPLKGCW